MDPLNYSPISLYLIITKVVESIITVDIKSFLFSISLISDHHLIHTWSLCLGHAASTLPTMVEVLYIRREIRAVSLNIS